MSTSFIGPKVPILSVPTVGRLSQRPQGFSGPGGLFKVGGDEKIALINHSEAEDISEYSVALASEAMEAGSNVSALVPPVSLDVPSEPNRRPQPPPPLRLMGGSEAPLDPQSEMPPIANDDRGYYTGSEANAEALRPPPLPQKMGLVGQKSLRIRAEALNHTINGAQAANGSLSPGNPSVTSSTPLPTSALRLNHDGPAMAASSNGPPPTSTSATPPDWIELSSTLSKDLKRDILSKGLKKKIVSATSELIKQDDSEMPLLPKEDPATPSISASTPPPSATTSPSHTMLSSLNKGRAPQPPGSHRGPPPPDVVVNQPIRSSSISRGLQVEAEDLIQFSNTCSNANHNGRQAPPGTPDTTLNNNNNNNNNEKRVKRRHPSPDLFDGQDLAEEYEDEDLYEDLDGSDSLSSVRTTEERMEYLESLEKCPCYAKCCIDSVVTLFCVTLLG